MLLTSGIGGGPSRKILLRIGIKNAAVLPEPTTKTINIVKIITQ